MSLVATQSPLEFDNLYAPNMLMGAPEAPCAHRRTLNSNSLMDNLSMFSAPSMTTSTSLPQSPSSQDTSQQSLLFQQSFQRMRNGSALERLRSRQRQEREEASNESSNKKRSFGTLDKTRRSPSMTSLRDGTAQHGVMARSA